MRIAVVYSSKTGFTKKYAEWIASSLEADIYQLSEFDAEAAREHEILIYGGGLYASGINGIKKFRSIVSSCGTKAETVYFATGASPMRDDVHSSVLEHNFSVEERDGVKLFYMRGGYDYSRLGGGDKVLMKMMKFMIGRKPESERTSDEKGMSEIILGSTDFTDEANAQSLIEYVRAITK